MSEAESRLLSPSSTCGEGAPQNVQLACGVRAAHPRVPPLGVRPGETITLRFEADVARLLVQEKRAGRSGPVEEVSQLMPVPEPEDRRVWTLPVPPRVGERAVIGLVALYDEIHIRNLTGGAIVPLQDAVVQFQLPLGPRP